MDSLYILRHGIALPHGTPGIADAERPLTPKGEARIKILGRALRRLDLDLQRIVTSPLPRARRTAEIVADALDLTEALEDCPTLASGTPPRAIRDWLAGRTEQRLMIVGHNPDFTDLVGLLLGLSSHAFPFELRKGGLAALAASPTGGFELDWLLTPGLVRRLAT